MPVTLKNFWLKEFHVCSNKRPEPYQWGNSNCDNVFKKFFLNYHWPYFNQTLHSAIYTLVTRYIDTFYSISWNNDHIICWVFLQAWLAMWPLGLLIYFILIDLYIVWVLHDVVSLICKHNTFSKAAWCLHFLTE